VRRREEDEEAAGTKENLHLAPISHLDDCNIPQLFVVNGVLLDLYDRRVSIDEEGI
jgi:hypothetical protein